MKRHLAAALAALLLLSGCGGQAAPADGSPEQPAASISEPDPAASAPAVPEPEPPTAEERVEALLSSMSLEEQVGQCFFVRCPASDAVGDVTAYHLGGYLLFGRDFQDSAGGWLTEEQFTSTVQSYQDAALADTGIPMLIGVDEEGGTVVRASRNPNLRSARFRSPQELYDAGGIDAVLQDTVEKDRLLSALGINVNFAPVADVSTDPADFIYARSLGQDAQTTAGYVAAVTRQMALDGMGSVMKHFPGYGNNADTHTGIAVDGRALEAFETADLLPFLAGADCGYAEKGSTTSVLVSHNIVQCMDPNLPASLSPAVHEYLRRELGFGDGVVMTDDLAMEAVAAYAGDGAVAVMALQAGNDLVVTSDYRTQIPKVLEAVADGTLARETIESACRRVLTWKQSLGLVP